MKIGLTLVFDINFKLLLLFFLNVGLMLDFGYFTTQLKNNKISASADDGIGDIALY